MCRDQYHSKHRQRLVCSSDQLYLYRIVKVMQACEAVLEVELDELLCRILRHPARTQMNESAGSTAAATA